MYKYVLGAFLAVMSAIFMAIYPVAASAVFQEGGNVAFVVLATTFCRSVSMGAFSLYRKEVLFRKGEGDRKAAIIGGVFNTLNISLVSASVYFISPSLVMLIVYMYVFLLLIAAIIKGDEKFNAVNILSVLVALLGLYYVLDISSLSIGASNTSLIGILLAFGAMVSIFIRAYFLGKEVSRRHPIVVGAESFTVGLFLQIAFIWFFQIPIFPDTIFGLAVAILSCMSLVAGSFFMLYSMALMGAYRTSMFMKVEPLFTVIFSALLLGEILSFSQYAGGMLIVGSLICLSATKRRSA